jgi:glucose/arabinose dehydrogenase
MPTILHLVLVPLETRARIWLYDANKKDQLFSPAECSATGMRNGGGFAFNAAERLFVTRHGRDQLSQNCPSLERGSRSDWFRRAQIL